MPGATFLRGDRVTLRTIEEEDLQFLRETLNEPEVRRYLGQQTPTNMHQEREWFEERGSSDESVNLLVCVGEDGTDPAGTVGFGPADAADGSAELGLFLAPDYWGQGYGTEAARLATTYAFAERRLHRMVARAVAENAASCRIWEKLGFREEGRFREAAFHGGEYRDVVYYAVLADEWDHW